MGSARACAGAGHASLAAAGVPPARASAGWPPRARRPPLEHCAARAPRSAPSVAAVWCCVTAAELRAAALVGTSRSAARAQGERAPPPQLISRHPQLASAPREACRAPRHRARDRAAQASARVRGSPSRFLKPRRSQVTDHLTLGRLRQVAEDRRAQRSAHGEGARRCSQVRHHHHPGEQHGLLQHHDGQRLCSSRLERTTIG